MPPGPDCPDGPRKLSTPSGSPVDACIRYYDIDCLHGLAIGSEPSTMQVTDCVAAIKADGCAVVATPESDPFCAWLVPPADVDASEAGVDADAADAADTADAPDAD